MKMGVFLSALFCFSIITSLSCSSSVSDSEVYAHMARMHGVSGDVIKSLSQITKSNQKIVWLAAANDAERHNKKLAEKLTDLQNMRVSFSMREKKRDTIDIFQKKIEEKDVLIQAVRDFNYNEIARLLTSNGNNF